MKNTTTKAVFRQNTMGELFQRAWKFGCIAITLLYSNSIFSQVAPNLTHANSTPVGYAGINNVLSNNTAIYRSAVANGPYDPVDGAYLTGPYTNPGSLSLTGINIPANQNFMLEFMVQQSSLNSAATVAAREGWEVSFAPSLSIDRYYGSDHRVRLIDVASTPISGLNNNVVNQLEHIRLVRIGLVYTIYVNGASMGTYSAATAPAITTVSFFNSAIGNTIFENLKVIPLKNANFADNNATDEAVPNVPTGLAVTNTASATELKLDWTAPADNGTIYYYYGDGVTSGLESNLIVTPNLNSNFEQAAYNTSTWTKYNNVGDITPSLETSQRFQQAKSLRMSWLSGVTAAGVYNEQNTYTAGQKYHVSAWTRQGSGNGQFGLWCHSVNAPTNDLTTALALPSTTLWEQHQMSYVPSGTRIRIHLRYDGASGAGSLLVDNVRVRKITEFNVVAGIHEYQVQSTSPATVDYGYAAGITRTITGLTPNTQYCFQVRARDNAINPAGGADRNVGGWTTSVCKWTRATQTTSFTTSLTSCVSGSVTLNWGGGAWTNVRIYCTQTGTSIYTGSASSFTHTGLTPGTTYNYTLYVRNGEGLEETTTSTVAITLPVITAATITSVVTNETCESLNNGSITSVNISGGLSRVRYIRVQQNRMDGDAWINLMDLAAYEIFTNSNVALNKTVSSANVPGFGTLHAYFVDQDYGTTYHSSVTGAGEWVEVDLGAEYNLDKIKIWNRPGVLPACCGDRSNNMKLILKNGSGTVIDSRNVDIYQNTDAASPEFNVLDVSWSDGATTLNRTGLDAGSYTLNYADASGCSTVTHTKTIGTDFSMAPPVYTAANITVGPVPAVNGTALLPDANFNTNGAEYTSHESYRGRLFNMGPGVRGWAGTGSPNYWQVDLGSIKPINGIITQGRGDFGCTISCFQWCTTYEVRISTDNTNWTSLGIFNGNSDETTPVTNMFANQTTNARYVRVYPVTYNSYPVMRFEIISIPSLCATGTQSVSVSAEPNAGANTIRWYTAASGGTLLHTGQFYTASISSTTNFYAASYNSTSGCESLTRTLVTAQVGVAVGSEPAAASSLPAICTDFVSTLPTGWKTDHQALVTPSTSTTHDCSGLAASMNAPGHYVWVKYNANATNVRYSLKLNNNAASAIRYLLVEQSVDGCVWTPVAIHTNASVATDLSIVDFTGTLNAASRHVRFNMTRRDVSGGRVEVDNVIVYNGSLPAVALAPTGSSKTCKVYGNHWVNFYTASNELIGSVKANGALDGSTNDLGDVTLTVNVGAAGSMFACNTSSNPLYETAYMGRSWTVSSTNFSNSANFTNPVSIRMPYSTTELTALNAAATATGGNPNDNGANVGNLMLTKISGGTPVNFNPTDNCGNGTITGISQLSNGALTTPFPTMSTAGSFADFNVGQFSEMYLHKNYSVSPLPVTLTNFSANCNDQNAVDLNWSTASESNSQKFVVEKSRDIVNWLYVSEVQAAGNSSIALHYQSEDEEAYPGISYYRLVQVDNDGANKMYGPISVSCSSEENSMIVFPNPAEGNFTVEITSNDKINATSLLVADVAGKIVSVRSLNLNIGKNQVLFERDELQSGVYIIQLISGQELKPVRLVIN